MVFNDIEVIGLSHKVVKKIQACFRNHGDDAEYFHECVEDEIETNKGLFYNGEEGSIVIGEPLA